MRMTYFTGCRNYYIFVTNALLAIPFDIDARRSTCERLFNPWPSRPLPGDGELPLMSACPVAALPNARLPPAKLT